MLAFVAGVASGSFAQTREPFSTLAVSADVVANVASGRFGDYWDPGVGLRVDVETPFYLGAVQLGLHVCDNHPGRADLRDFWSGYIYLGWMGERRLAPFRLSLGALAGNFLMDFGEYSLEGGKRFESELAASALAGVACDVTELWTVQVRVEARRVFTAEKINLVSLSVGARRYFTSPRWLREVLD